SGLLQRPPDSATLGTVSQCRAAASACATGGAGASVTLYREQPPPMSAPAAPANPRYPPLPPPLGVIEEVHGPVIDSLCERLPPLREAVFVRLDGERYTFEVPRHLDESRARAIALHRTVGLQCRLPVYDTGGPLQVPVTPDCLGRLL